ncbi:hypothetical protein Ancab_037585 [Ancistrocladus abbreviatus]
MASLCAFSNLDEPVEAVRDIWYKQGCCESLARSNFSSRCWQILLLSWGFVLYSPHLYCCRRYADCRAISKVGGSLRHYSNGPIVEFEIAAHEQMKITELLLARLLEAKLNASATHDQSAATVSAKAGGVFLSEMALHYDGMCSLTDVLNFILILYYFDYL